jgi:hypothetical protein
LGASLSASARAQIKTMEITMLYRGLFIFTALSFVVVNSASAADLCFRYTTSGGGTLVM